MGAGPDAGDACDWRSSGRARVGPEVCCEGPVVRQCPISLGDGSRWAPGAGSRARGAPQVGGGSVPARPGGEGSIPQKGSRRSPAAGRDPTGTREVGQGSGGRPPLPPTPPLLPLPDTAGGHRPVVVPGCPCSTPPTHTYIHPSAAQGGCDLLGRSCWVGHASLSRVKPWSCHCATDSRRTTASGVWPGPVHLPVAPTSVLLPGRD